MLSLVLTMRSDIKRGLSTGLTFLSVILEFFFSFFLYVLYTFVIYRCRLNERKRFSINQCLFLSSAYLNFHLILSDLKLYFKTQEKEKTNCITEEYSIKVELPYPVFESLFYVKQNFVYLFFYIFSFSFQSKERDINLVKTFNLLVQSISQNEIQSYVIFNSIFHFP